MTFRSLPARAIPTAPRLAALACIAFFGCLAAPPPLASRPATRSTGGSWDPRFLAAGAPPILAAIEHDLETKPHRAGRRVLINVITFAVLTGLRLNELCNVRWRDVRLYEPPKRTRSGGVLYGWISVRSEENALTKTGDEDRVPVVPQAYELLLRLREAYGSSSYLFEAPRKGGRLSDWWVSNRFREYRKLAKIRNEIHFHSLRHTCASWLAEAGVDLKVIQEILRHSNIKQTMRYAHLIPEVVANKMVGAFEQIRIELQSR